jgi:hypothetical protein
MLPPSLGQNTPVGWNHNQSSNCDLPPPPPTGLRSHPRPPPLSAVASLASSPSVSDHPPSHSGENPIGPHTAPRDDPCGTSRSSPPIDPQRLLMEWGLSPNMSALLSLGPDAPPPRPAFPPSADFLPFTESPAGGSATDPDPIQKALSDVSQSGLEPYALSSSLADKINALSSLLYRSSSPLSSLDSVPSVPSYLVPEPNRTEPLP